MAYFLFIDESGQDHHESPYEVLAGFSIRDADLWEFIKGVHSIEYECFGRRYRETANEIKARKFLKRKTFKHAAQMPPIPLPERRALAKEALDHGESVSRRALTALAQAKLDYVDKILSFAHQYRGNAFACVIADPSKMPLDDELLRKDYVYLFERFFYYLEDKKNEPQGIVVFDELEKTKSHILLTQMDRYFKRSAKGRERASLIIPEPFFVHSDLTTGIQLVDFIAYIVSWSFRIKILTKPKRIELEPLMERVASLRYLTDREVLGRTLEIWSVTIV